MGEFVLSLAAARSVCVMMVILERECGDCTD